MTCKHENCERKNRLLLWSNLLSFRALPCSFSEDYRRRRRRKDLLLWVEKKNTISAAFFLGKQNISQVFFPYYQVYVERERRILCEQSLSHFRGKCIRRRDRDVQTEKKQRTRIGFSSCFFFFCKIENWNQDKKKKKKKKKSIVSLRHLWLFSIYSRQKVKYQYFEKI